MQAVPLNENPFWQIAFWIWIHALPFQVNPGVHSNLAVVIVGAVVALICDVTVAGKNIGGVSFATEVT